MKKIAPALVKTWLDSSYLFRHNDKKLRNIALEKIHLYFGSTEAAKIYIDECKQISSS